MPNNFKDKKKYIDQVTRDLDRTVTSLSEQVLKVIIEKFVDKLDRKGDQILNTSKNMQLVATIDKVYQQFMANQGSAITKKLYDGTRKITQFNVDYFADMATGQAKYKASTDRVKTIINDRLGIGDGTRLKPGGYMDSLMKDTSVANKIKQLSYQEVLKGSGFNSFKNGLATIIYGKESDGRLSAFKQYFRNYAYDTFVKVDRAESAEFAKDLNLEFFIYDGGVIETSRDFCIERNGNVYSVEEAQKWKDDPWIKLNLDKGYITSYDPINDVGLFGCRHLARFVSRQVAESIRPDLKKDRPINADPEKKNETPAKNATFVAAGKKVTGQFTNVQKSVQKKFSKAIEIIDSVHGDGDLKDIPIKKENMRSAAVFASRMADLEPVYIALNPKTTEFAEFALIHEMGHFFDNYSLGKRNAFESDNKKGILKNVIAKATESKAIKGIQEILDRNTIFVDGQEEVMDAGYRDYVSYLVKPTEIWARAYTQFIAKRSGSKPVQNGVEKFFASHLKNGIKAQWDDDDFEEIEKEIEAMMISQGWIKKSNPE